MRITKKVKKFFGLRPKVFRKSGHYWVQYSYEGARRWRIAWYNEMLEHWELGGSDRFYYDNDLIQINERPITRWWYFEPFRKEVWTLVGLAIGLLTPLIPDLINYITRILK